MGRWGWEVKEVGMGGKEVKGRKASGFVLQVKQ